MYLIHEDLWQYVTGDVNQTSGTSSTKEDVDRDFTYKDQRALAKISLLIAQNLQAHVKSCRTSKEAWENLSKAFSHSGILGRLAVYRQLMNTTLHGMSVQDYLGKILDLSQQLTEMNKPLEDEFLAVIMLNGLTDDYEPFVMSLGNSDHELTSDFVKNKLLSENSRRQTNEESACANALHTRYSSAKKRSKCEKCGMNNHTTAQHGIRKSNYQPNQPRREGQPGQSTSQPSQSKKKSTTPAARQVSLFTALKATTAEDKFVIDSGCNVHVVSDKTSFDNFVSKPLNLTLANNQNAIVRGQGDVTIPTTNLVLRDALYSPGICTNLISVSKMVEKGLLVTFDHDGCKVTQQDGDIVATASVKNGLYILDVPSSDDTLAKNTDCDTQRNNQTSWANVVKNHASGSTTQVKSQKSLSEPGTQVKNYKVPVHTQAKLEKSPVHTRAKSHNSHTIWHQRLAHLNHRSMRQLKNGLATGISFTEGNFEPCIPCIEGKIKRKPIPSKPGTRAKGALDLVHMDISVVQVPTIEGYRFALILIDDFSRKTFIYLLRHKSETFTKFVEFQNLVERQLQRKLRVLRSDNALEFVKGPLAEHLKQNGIRHESSVKFTPQQNGVAEAAGKVIFQKTRCMLRQAGLPKSYWGLAAQTACYIKNRSPTASLVNNTPEGAWSGKEIDLSHLKVFGCVAYERKDQYHKLDARAEKYLFVGYSETQKGGYILLDPRYPKRQHVGRNIVFIENQFYSNIIGKPTPTDDNFGNDDVSTDAVTIQLDPPAPTMVTRSRGKVLTTATERPTSVTEDTAAAVDDVSDGDDDDVNDDLASQGAACPSPNTTHDITNSDDCEYVPTDDDEYNDDFSHSPITTRNRANILHENIILQAMCFDNEPKTVEEALRGRNGLNWREAMASELKSMYKNQVWKLVDRPPNVKPVTCRWIYKIKRRADNTIERYKARLVARGFSQYLPHEDKTYSPVMRQSTLKMILALAVEREMSINHWDVQCAFLYGVLPNPVYMEQPEGYEDGTGRLCLLNKAIYGLKNAGRAWYQRLTDHLIFLTFVQSEVDPCVFTLTKGESMVIIGIWVDDLLVTSNDPHLLRLVKIEIEGEFEIRDLGAAKQLLGLNIQQDDKILHVNQCHYIANLLETYNMTDCKPISTPMEFGLKLKSEPEATKVNEPYRELIGSLIWLSTCTRPDIAYATSKLASFCSHPTEAHWKAAKRVLRYLKATQNIGISYSKKSSEMLQGYSDADWAGDIEDRKSTSGFVFMLSGGAICWESRKQRCVSLSSCESEYISLSDAAKELTFLISLYESITGSKAQTPVIYNDSQSAQKLADNPMTTPRSKHIDTKYHHIRQCLENKLFTISYVPTTEMAADVLTKALPAPAHTKCIMMMGLK